MASENVVVERAPARVPRWLRALLGLLGVASAMALLALGWSRTGAPLTVSVDGRRHDLRTHAATVEDALRQAGIALYPEDQVLPPLEAALEPGVAIQVQRARPVAVRADGQTQQLRTHALTVGACLAEAGVGVGPGDEIWLGQDQVRLDTPLFGAAPTGRQVSYRGGLRAEASAAGGEPPVIALRRAANLVLQDGDARRTMHTTATTVGQVLEEHGVRLYLGDEIQPGLQVAVSAGMTVTIQRSVPVEIVADGHTLRTRTLAGTIAGLLGQEGVALMGKDQVEPGLSDPVRAGMQIQVTRVREDLVVEFDNIPFKTVWVADPELEIDNTRLVQSGQPGINKRRYRVVYEDGHEVSRFLEDSWAEQPPITKTLAYGTQIVVRTLDTPDGPIEYWRKMRVYTTSYKPSSAGKPKTHPRYGYTRLGIYLRKGIVAVDPTVIPLKTMMYVPGYGIAKAGDTGGGVKGKFVDLGFSDNDYESWHWWTDIYLLTPVPPRSQIRWTLPDYPNFPDRRR
ncbi:MAG: ubiquitin-like domain-containing protein [Anaerolineae bacterium]|nr:ubiquitin-like domain-containing protein [Anaerolineae bacterium]